MSKEGDLTLYQVLKKLGYHQLRSVEERHRLLCIVRDFAVTHEDSPLESSCSVLMQAIEREPKTDNSRQLIRNRELARRRTELWNLQPFRFFWYRVQRHRFAPDHVYLRYWRISMQKSNSLALRQE